VSAVGSQRQGSRDHKVPAADQLEHGEGLARMEHQGGQSDGGQQAVAVDAGGRPEIGHVTSGVVRIADTVRRPVGPWTDTVDVLLKYLHDVGFTAAPRPLGRDEQGRATYC
jgi:hypothetical protein